MDKTKIVAGQKGIENQIKWVTILEVLEDIERLQKGEFLITTGFNLMEDKERLETFHQLLRSRVLSGIAIYTSFYMEKIPDSFIEIANKHDLPLIEIPTDINFSEITRAILEQIVNKQAHLLEQSEKIHRKLTNLLLNDRSLYEVTKYLGQLTSANIIIYNEFFDISHSNFNSSSYETSRFSQTTFTINKKSIDLSDYLVRSMEKEAKENVRFESNILTVYPIIAKQSCFGWIVMSKPEEKWQELDDIAIERAASIYAMEFLKKQAVEETQLRIQSNLLEDILNGNYSNKKTILDQAQKLDYNLSLNQSVYHITFKNIENISNDTINKLYHITKQHLTQKNKQYIIQTKMNSIIFLTNVVGDTKKEKYSYSLSLANELKEKWQFHYPSIDLLIGIGRNYHRLEDLGKSAEEAHYAVKLSGLINQDNQCIHYEDLGMYDLLLDIKRSGINLKSIFENNISGLLNNTDKEINLIKTAEAYFRNNYNIKKAAAELFIHRHTLKYRLNQIERKTGLDIQSASDLLKLQLGIMAYKLNQFLNSEK